MPPPPRGTLRRRHHPPQAQPPGSRCPNAHAYLARFTRSRCRFVLTVSALPVGDVFSPGWRRASSAVPDPVPSEEPASASTVVVVTEEKPDSPAEEKSEEVAEVSSGSSLEAAVAAPATEEDGGVDDILSKLDIQVTPTYVLYGSGAFIVLWVLSSVVSAIDSIPLVPNVLELIGTGYTIWFTARYLLFKESRDKLFAKFEDLKERII
ncbi:hypothetical protein GUJ93_ZPchr0006g42042 [Zizania palustris]|uniref:Cyanobacterial aminoacyl-tRNA synthetase CAAD domain-containing protein n=1 Tax=Zizania palustris TaxID=103762 RepID=A0A8J5SCQ6_ZIZPA|nr:hypothetical protein GUJ93_ZPchr0006g42042 [Zizania palustris]